MNELHVPLSPTPAESLDLVGTRPKLGELLIGGLFVGFLIQQALSGQSTGGLTFIVLWIGFMQAKAFLDWLRPARIQLDGNRLRLRLFPLQKTNETTVSNLANLALTEGGLAVRFVDLEALTVSPEMRRHYQMTEGRTGFHVILPGSPFDLGQVNQLRQILGLPLYYPSQAGIEIQKFVDRLEVLTPIPWVTYGLIAANVIVFLVMQTQELAIWEPSMKSLIRWGANYGPKTLSTEWWRLLTHQFIHIGLLHLAFNTIILRQIGPMAERLLGSEMLLVGYIFSGVVGGLCSLFWSPVLISAGASGAIFGLFGMILGLLVRHRRWVPIELVTHYRNSILMFIAFNVYISFTIKGIDIAAHAGGLVGGIVFGLGATPVFVFTSIKYRFWQLIPITIVCLLLSVVGYRQLTQVADLPDAVQQVFVTEQEFNAQFQAILSRLVKGTLTADEAGAQSRQIITKTWHAARQEFDAIPNVTAEQRGLHQTISDYMKLREEACLLVVKSIENDDLAAQGDAMLKAEAANELLRQWAAANPTSRLQAPKNVPPQMANEIAVFVARLHRATSSWERAMTVHQAGQIDDEELMRRIQRDSLPELQTARTRFRQNAPNSVGADPKIIALISHFVEAQEHYWTLQVDVLENHSNGKSQRLEESAKEVGQLRTQLRRALSGQEQEEVDDEK